MCIIAAKYIKNVGWVLSKNRDQDYISPISFLHSDHPKVGEIFALHDENIEYKEGMNKQGLVIITTSLTPNLMKETNKEDGAAVYAALSYSDPEEAARFLVKKKITGFIFLSTPEKLVLIEAAKKDHGDGEYESKVRIVPKTEIVVRTNHGIDLPWAGFQYGYSDKEDIWRKSSELRKKYAEKAIDKTNTAEDMLLHMAKRMTDDFQLNQFRIEYKPRQMRTIFQWAFVPSQKIVYIRPIQAKMKLQDCYGDIKAKVIDNKDLQKVYNNKIKHLCKILPDEKTGCYKTVIPEQYMSFREYINMV